MTLRPTLLRSAPLLALLLLPACSSTTVEIEVDSQVIEELTFAPSLGIDLSTYERLPSSGIYIKDLMEGAGEILQPQDLATVEYKGWLYDGTLVYDASRTWQLGNFEQPLGMEYGSLFMKVGGTRRMIVPPALGWGDLGSPDGRVPPGFVVVFEVTLVRIGLEG